MTLDNTEIPYVNSIFQQPWWLNAVAPDRWSEVVLNVGDKIVARLPYTIEKKFSLTLLRLPPLTQTLGPWLRPSAAKYTNQLAEQKELMSELIKQLPAYDYFAQQFHYSITNWLPFYWNGFNQTTRYTYVIENLEDLDLIWHEFRENIRREIRKAQKQVRVRTDLGIERFLDINLLTFQRQGEELPYSRELVRRLDAACAERQARQIFFAEDAKGQVHAAIYIVWDNNSAYYLMGGGDPKLRSSGATSLLMWEAIKFTSTVTNKFDFEGSMGEAVERFFRAFGARQIPYFRVTHMSRRMKLLMAGREMVKAFV
ncbi:MAG: GNAT family N-acetyltransferase [Coleofasciculus sp. G3-WIS-01]|uniref:GNAT family N-acetyltransferase n=1 Tax=Coleofasciculus sp. G3-WIS-01 TaxID=3069528 RepID=UPI0032F75B27